MDNRKSIGVRWMPEMKPCPFCGSKIIVIKSPIGVIFFKCAESGCIVSFDTMKYNKHPEKAIEAFNRRAVSHDERRNAAFH